MTASGKLRRQSLLAEFGVVVPKGIADIKGRVPQLIEDASVDLPGAFGLLMQRLLERLTELSRQVTELEAQIKAWHQSNPLRRNLEALPGIGPISASALVASVGDAKSFDNGRQLAAWLGWCRASTPAAVKMYYWVSVSGAMVTSERC